MLYLNKTYQEVPPLTQAQYQCLLEIAPESMWHYLEPDIYSLQTRYYSDVLIILKGHLVKADNPNQIFQALHQNLTGNHYFAFVSETAENIKFCYQNKYPRSLFFLFYSIHFITHRLLPKLKGFRKLCRHLKIPIDMSKSEILGRLIYNGFDIIQVLEEHNNTLFIAKVSDCPIPGKSQKPASEGFLFSMERVGQNEKPIRIYKFRSMHPYAEYVQEYMHRIHGLEAGGKFKNDFRVSTGGRIIRKYWIDELPMLLNLIKGDIKFIGVRPISLHYYKLYPKTLQELRIKYRPGLLPPYYADLPETFDEIVNSELKYLEAYKKSPIRTDLIYFFRILKNIFINKARSK